jgi:hypothetical protein
MNWTKGENAMTTKETVQGYFTTLKEHRDWESFLINSFAIYFDSAPFPKYTK